MTTARQTPKPQQGRAHVPAANKLDKGKALPKRPKAKMKGRRS